MDIFFSLFKIFSFFLLLLTKPSSANYNCTSYNCGNLSLDIHFPFRIQGLQPQHCGLPEFNHLSCTGNKTIIHFPKYGDLVVKSISYDTKRINLLDPKNCMHEVFLNLNLSSTPFAYYYALKEYKYINCSEKITSLNHVPCLSGSGYYYVYIVEPSFSVPSSCSCVKTVAIPFSYTPYISDNSFGLGLTWDSTGRSDDEETKSGFTTWTLYERLQAKKYFKASGVIGFLLLVGMMFYAAKSLYREELKREKLKTKADEVEVNRFQGEYEALDPERAIKANFFDSSDYNFLREPIMARTN